MTTIEALDRLESAPKTYGLIDLNTVCIPANVLLQLARAGVVELRPASKVGGKYRAGLPKGLDGTVLCFARLL